MIRLDHLQQSFLTLEENLIKQRKPDKLQNYSLSPNSAQIMTGSDPSEPEPMLFHNLCIFSGIDLDVPRKRVISFVYVCRKLNKGFGKARRSTFREDAEFESSGGVRLSTVRKPEGFMKSPLSSCDYLPPSDKLPDLLKYSSFRAKFSSLSSKKESSSGLFTTAASRTVNGAHGQTASGSF